MQAKSIRLHETGGPEVLKLETLDLDQPGAGQVLLRHKAVGLNYIDIYLRSGLYPLPALPSGLGLEASGVIEAVGDDVDDLSPGDRVAYAGGPVGAYAEARIMPAANLVKLPDSIDFDTAAAMMLQGMTVEYLTERTYPVKSGDQVLLHAAAGGVGLIACQWLSHLGATIIGTVGSDAKAELAKAHGCHHTINYREENVAERVREITKGAGVNVVYDSIGKDTWEASLNSLRPRGLMVTFGNASGPVPPVDLGVLAQKGSLYVTRPTLFSYNAAREDLLHSAGRVFEMVTSGKVEISIKQRYDLADAAQAHRDMEARRTTGSSILVP